MTLEDKIIRIHPNDNVVVALLDIAPGEKVEFAGREISVAEAIPSGHKIAIEPIASGEDAIKYGFPIGRASQRVEPGEWLHEHNLRTNLAGKLEYAWRPTHNLSTRIKSNREFQGFVRSDGSVGIRNEIWIVPTVGCVNETAAELVRRLEREGTPETVDGVHAFAHPQGCSQMGLDHDRTRHILARLARHPNAGGVLVLGLGCENNTMASFRELLGPVDPKRVDFLVAQEVEDEMAAGLEKLRRLARNAGAARRQTVDAARLRVGLKCGGSDAFSGLTANPLVGAVCDKLTALGVATILTEVPEMFGAETILFERCRDRQVFERAVRMVNRLKEHFLARGEPVGENHSPGNREGGLTTLEEKSLGCVQKAGRSTVQGVLDYGEAVASEAAGLHLLEGPGNDMVAVTALAAAGAHLTLFTTGRGTPLGGPTPTIKIASNASLARRKPNWIDFDASALLSANGSMETLSEELLEMVLSVASGQSRTRNERNAQRSFAVWKTGVTL